MSEICTVLYSVLHNLPDARQSAVYSWLTPNDCLFLTELQLSAQLIIFLFIADRV